MVHHTIECEYTKYTKYKTLQKLFSSNNSNNLGWMQWQYSTRLRSRHFCWLHCIEQSETFILQSTWMESLSWLGLSNLLSDYLFSYYLHPVFILAAARLHKFACICCIFFCSFSFWVSANLTTIGAKHPSMVCDWCKPCNYTKTKFTC